MSRLLLEEEEEENDERERRQLRITNSTRDWIESSST
jgi:hypothetical protein